MWFSGWMAMASVNFALEWQLAAVCHMRGVRARIAWSLYIKKTCEPALDLQSRSHLHSLVEILLSNRLVAQGLQLVCAHDGYLKMKLEMKMS